MKNQYKVRKIKIKFKIKKWSFKMLDINKLSQASEILSIRRLCKEAGVNYFNIHQKIYRHKQDPKYGKLNNNEVFLLQQVLKRYNFQIL